MFLLNDLKTVALRGVAPGHLVILKRRVAFGAAIVGADPGPKANNDPPTPVLVDLTPGCAPVLYAPQTTSGRCIDLGKPRIRAAGERGWLSADAGDSRPGHVAVGDAGAWIVCEDAPEH
jgi:hypothetical protein